LTAADRADLALVVERLQGVLARADATPQPTEIEPAVPPPEEAPAVLLSLASILGVR
jgi:hypothetical protein